MGHENCFSNWRDHTSSGGMGSCLGDRAFNTFQLSGVNPTPKLPNRPVRRDENVCKNSMDLFCLRLVEGSTGFCRQSEIDPGFDTRFNFTREFSIRDCIWLVP